MSQCACPNCSVCAVFWLAVRPTGLLFAALLSLSPPVDFFAPPPPPVWPEPRAQEPELSDLGVAELVERLARALQREGEMQREAEQRKRTPSHTRPAPPDVAPRRSGEHRHDSALAPANRPAANVDQALRSALDRLSRLDDVA